MEPVKEHNPPLLPLVFFRWFCRREFREDIEGDLLEHFHTHVAEFGTRKAGWIFTKNVLSLFRPGLIRFPGRNASQNLFNMKKNSWLTLGLLVLVVILMIVSPFMPGPSNPAVLWASVIGQMAGTAGLLLVPIGISWTVLEIRSARHPNNTLKKWPFHLAVITVLFIALVFLCGALLLPNPMPKLTCLFGLLMILTGFFVAQYQIRAWKDNHETIADNGARFMLAVSAAACIVFIYLFLDLFVLVGVGIVPGIAVLLLLPISLPVVIRKIKEWKDAREKKFNPVPVYFSIIPVVALLVFLFVMRPASDLSRNFAIERAEVLIRAIEEHKKRTGQYPEDLGDLPPGVTKQASRPNVMGIRDFRYTRINGQFSLSFSQWLDLGSLEVIVLYDKSNLKDNLQGSYAKYDHSLDLHRVRTAFDGHDTKYDNWRYYLVD